MPKRTRSYSTPTENDGDATPPKPAASFNGALSQFAFTSSKPMRPARTAALKQLASHATRFVSSSSSKPISTKSPSTKPTSSSTSTPSSSSAAVITTTDTETSDAKPATKKKRRKKHPGIAPATRYAHLPPGIPDVFAPNLLCVFIGINPGLATVKSGHAYSSPSNGFWKLLHASGLTPDRRMPPTQDLELPERYGLGNTNIVSRPTRDQAELTKAEMEDGVPILEEKMRKWKPESVCVVGKGIWERIFKVKMGRPMKAKDGFKFGWQEGWRMGAEAGEGGWEGARCFVAVSTSGLVAGYSPAKKEEIFKELGSWVNQRREELGDKVPREVDEEELKEIVRKRREEWQQGVVKWEAWVKLGEDAEMAAKEWEDEKDGGEMKKELDDGEVKKELDDE